MARIPVHIKRPGIQDVALADMPTVAEKEALEPISPVVESERPAPRPAPGASAPAQARAAQPETETLEAWRERAMRLQADMENFRKLQQRLAQDAINAERNRLLLSFLSVADNLERALEAELADAASLRQGVALAHQALLQILSREGVERIEAQGQPFDPAWHEAVDSIAAQGEPGRIVQVAQAGYRQGERLLRPARVVVAK